MSDIAKYILKAQKAVRTAFDALNIKVVVFVDDYFLNSPKIEDFIASTLVLLDSGQELSIFPDKLKEIDYDLPEEILRVELTKLWNSVETDEKELVLKELKVLTNQKQVEEDNTAVFLHKLLPRIIRYYPLTPDQWESDGRGILDQASDKNRILCFFDQQLSEDSGRQGIELLKNTIGLNDPNIICTLLTHTVAIESEIIEWKNISDSLGLELSKFLILSKQRLSPENNPFNFALGIKISLMNHLSHKLKDLSFEIYNSATQIAKLELDEINVYDFNAMVLKSSKIEGIWEPDTLFRIFGIFHWKAAQKLALSTRHSFNQSIKVIRKLEQIGPAETTSIPQNQVLVRRKELFDDNEINELQYPLQLGDLFEIIINGEIQNYILLTQSCDLALRDDGRRRAKIGILAKISDSVEDPTVSSCYRLDYFDKPSNSDSFVKFQDVLHIELDVLDLAVTRTDGKCIFEMGLNTDHLHDPINKRIRKINQFMNEVIGKYNEFRVLIESSNIEDEKRGNLLQALLPVIFIPRIPTFSPTVEANMITYNIKRVGRLRKPFSDVVLETYGTFISRHAQEHDFSIIQRNCEQISAS